MAAINRAALNALALSLIPGSTRTSAAQMRQMLAAIIESLASILDDKNAANGYAGLDANSNVDRTKVFKVKTDAGTGLVMDKVTYSDWVSTNAGAVVWTSPAVSGDRIYRVANMGTNNLTINYPGGATKIVDVLTSIVPANTIVIASGRAKTIIDNGVNLIFF